MLTCHTTGTGHVSMCTRSEGENAGAYRVAPTALQDASGRVTVREITWSHR